MLLSPGVYNFGSLYLENGRHTQDVDWRSEKAHEAALRHKPGDRHYGHRFTGRRVQEPLHLGAGSQGRDIHRQA